jgi:hypothetical protein
MRGGVPAIDDRDGRMQRVEHLLRGAVCLMLALVAAPISLIGWAWAGWLCRSIGLLLLCGLAMAGTAVLLDHLFRPGGFDGGGGVISFVVSIFAALGIMQRFNRIPVRRD